MKAQDEKMKLPILFGQDNFIRFTPESIRNIEKRIAQEEAYRAKGVVPDDPDEKPVPEPNKDLDAWKPLPFIFGDIPSGMVSTPLEDLDPYYGNQMVSLWDEVDLDAVSQNAISAILVPSASNCREIMPEDDNDSFILPNNLPTAYSCQCRRQTCSGCHAALGTLDGMLIPCSYNNDFY